MITIHVEFFGIPRMRAGQATAELKFDRAPVPLGDVIIRLGEVFPALVNECIEGQSIRDGYITNINGATFVGDAQLSLADGDRLLLLSADAGG